jgi:uncharacterized protein (TIRG00374 family)
LRVNLGWVFAAIAVALSTYVLRALRWGLILRPVGKVATGKLIGATAAGFGTSTLLPARAGELVRPLLLTAQTGLPAAATLASILTERLLDGASVLALFAIGVLTAGRSLNPTQTPLLRSAALLAAVGVAVAVCFALILLSKRDATVNRLSRLFPARFQTRAQSFLHHVLDGLEVLRSPLRMIEITVWSLGMWVIIASQVVLLARGFGFPLSLGQAFVVTAVSVIGLAVPTPGGVGGFHAAIQFGLCQLVGIDLATATAFALLHHAICFFPITVIGLVYLGTAGFSLSRVQRLGADAPAVSTEA